MLKVTLPILSLLFSSTVYASGGGGFNTPGADRVQVDQRYELGRTYFTAPQADGSRLKYCVLGQYGMKKLSRRTVKEFKRGSASDFANALYNCDVPTQKIAEAITEEQGGAILYYLNKRYKLRLQASS